MSKLIKVARGYLELLLMRSTGQNPVAVRDELQPTLEMREFYASTMLIGTSGTPTVGALTGLVDTLVTTGPPLGVKAIGAALTIGAAAATNITLAVGIVVGSTQRVPLGAIHVGACAAAGVIEFGVVVPGWVLPPGSEFYARAEGTAAGADHVLDVHALIENYNLLG